MSGVAEPISQLIGRDAELRLAESLLASGRIVSLVGAGGAGKTRLALEIASRRRRSGGDVAVVDFSGLREASHIAGQVGAALGIQQGSGTEDGEAALLRELRTRAGLLLVLDNLEQVRGADAVLHRLLAGAPTLRILATSRLRIGVESETEVSIGPLPLPDSGSVADVAAAPATALFLARARDLGALRTLDAGEARDVADLCAALDGLPLALELAAARTRLLAPRAILRRLRESGPDDDMLRRPGERGPHRSFETVMEWSLGLLSSAERRMLFAVATCVGSFDLAIAARLCPGVNPLDALDRLVMHGLVRLEREPDGEPRFRLLTTVRASCLRRVPAREAAVLRRRHARAMLDLVVAERRHLAGPDAGRAASLLEAHLDDIRAAHDATLVREPGVAVRLVAEAWRFWPATGRLREGMDRLRAALARERAPTRVRGQGLAALAAFERRMAGRHASRTAALEALEVARRTRDRSIALEALPAVALAAIDDGELVAARRHAHRLIRLAVAAGDDAARARGLACLGVAEGELGDASAGIRYLHEAVALAHALGDPLNEAMQLENLAKLELVRGIPRSAALHARACVTILRTNGVPAELSEALALLGHALARIDRLDEARETLAEAVRLARALGSGEATTAIYLAALPYARRVGAAELVARLWGAAERAAGDRAESVHARDRALAQPELNVALVRLGPAALAAAVRDGRAADDEQLLDELGHLLERRRAGARGRAEVTGSTLTARETEVLLLVGEGLGDAAIASRLGISPKTVSVHVSNVKGKLGVETRVQAAMAARALEGAMGSVKA